MKRILRFAAVGAGGFAVDAAVLLLLLRFTVLGPFVARIIAITIAMVTTWLLNRTLTFGKSGRSLAAEGARYGGIGLSVSLANYMIYSGALLAMPGLPPLAALVLASGLATVLSYVGYSLFVFRS